MKILIVLAGHPPSKTLLKTEMMLADLVLAVDGAFNVFQKYKLHPDLVLGDMDSAEIKEMAATKILQLSDQDHTDLEKTLRYVFKSYSPASLIFLGAGGGRSDHLIHNLHICKTIDHSIPVMIKNELTSNEVFRIEIIQRITPNCEFNLEVKIGSTLSILPITDYSDLTSDGLKWEIEHRSSSEGFASQSNLVIKDDPSFKINSGCAYIAVYQ